MSYNWQKTQRAGRGVSVHVFVARAGPGNELVHCSVERKSSQKMEVRRVKCRGSFSCSLLSGEGQLQRAAARCRDGENSLEHLRWQSREEFSSRA